MSYCAKFTADDLWCYLYKRSSAVAEWPYNVLC